MSVFWIAARELKSNFTTALGWLNLLEYLLLTGVFWVIMVEAYVQQSMDLVHNPYAAQQLNLTDYLLLPFFGNCTVIVLINAPALSMRLFSEEFKQHTVELLLTSPVSAAQIVLGKYLGAIGMLAILLICTAHYPISLMMFAQPDPGVMIGGYAGLMLLGSAIIAMGMFVSSYTSSQVVAFTLTFGAALALYVLGMDYSDPDSLQTRLSLATHVSDLLRGEVRLSDLAFFGGFIGFFVFATHQRLESFRWR